MRAPRPGDGDSVLPYAETAAEPGHSVAPSAGSLGGALVAARPDDAGALVLARARVAQALFGTSAQSGLGRFRVLERLGAGGMGVVYSAYDPELDRGVALKVVHVPLRGRDAALAEAKALARLSHPNVVPIYDVGSEGEHVYIVMELVRGLTLRGWVENRPPPDIVDAYRQAGSALAAAHAAGLVHRDFKPDNAIVGSDGRVRVVDFGLACEAADLGRPAGALPVAGTPRYMAPEQAAGAPVTGAADQYSFCVALAEALGEGEPAPRWLAPILERGRATEPAARFDSMADLVRALGRDPVRVRHWRIGAGVLAVVAVVAGMAFAAGRHAPGTELCGGADAELAAVWTPPAQAAALARVAALGEYGRTLAPRLAQALRTHADRWTAAHRDACLAHRRGAQSDALLDRRMACLQRGRAALATVAALTAGADVAALPEVALAVRALPDPDRCADVDALLADVEPPPPAQSRQIADLRDRLEGTRVEIIAGRYAEAWTGAAAAVSAARALGYRPLIAEALLLAGRAASALEKRAEALPLLAEAARLAVSSGADALAVEAWGRRAYAQGTSGDAGDALAGIDVAEALAARPRVTRYARAIFYSDLGSVELARDRRQRARAAFERALAESQGVTGASAIELVAVRSNLALVIDEPRQRDELIADAEAELTRLLGADHPKTLRLRRMRGMVTVVDLGQAAMVLAPACAGFELHPTLAGNAVPCWVELGLVRSELGDDAGAVAALERALRLGGSGLTDLPETAPYLALWRGDTSAAARSFAAALALRPLVPDEPWWVLKQRGELQLGLGRALRAAGRLREARRALEPSVAALAQVARNHPAAAPERRLGRAQAELALTLAALGVAGAPLREPATAAAAWLRRAGAPSAERARLERLAAAP